MGKSIVNRLSVIRLSAIRLAAMCCLVIVLIPTAQAQLDAYSIQVAVADRSASEQQNAYLIGMRSVLLSNSGDKTLLNRSEVRAGLQQAESFVQAFSYSVPEPGTVIPRSTPLTDVVRKTGKATQLMLIQFDPNRITQLINSKQDDDNQNDKAPLNPFANVRSALSWLIIQDGNDPVLVGASKAQNIMERAREIAGGSGVALSFPAADDTDQQSLLPEDIKTGNVARINAASQRYASNLTLLAYLTRNRVGRWEGQWVKVSGQQKDSTSFTSKSLDEALQQGIAWLTQQSSAASGSLIPLTTTEALLWVSPISSTQSYSRVIEFLNSIDTVDSVYPKEILPGGIVFAVVPRNALSTVAAAASSTGWLQRSTLPVSANQSRYADSIALTFENLR